MKKAFLALIVVLFTLVFTAALFPDAFITSAETMLQLEGLNDFNVDNALKDKTESTDAAEALSDLMSMRSKLPVVYIDTYGKEPVQEWYQKATMSIFYNGIGVTNGMEDEPYFMSDIGIKRRGFASYWNFEDKYAFKAEIRDELGNDLKVPIFGFPAESDWVFHSTYADKSLVKNYFCYTLAKELRVYTPRIQLIELVMRTRGGKGELKYVDYRGVYAVVESVKQGKGRENIADFQFGDPSDTWATGGGYIVSRDKTREEESHFFITPRGDTISYVYPRWQDITKEQKEYIADEFSMIEKVLFSEDFMDPENGWRKYIDADSFVDYLLLNEVIKNQDGFIFSTYMTRDVGGKLKLGPVWDCDVGFGRTHYGDNVNPFGWYTLTLPWSERLCEDPYFANLIANRWKELRETIFSDENLLSYFDECIEICGQNAIDRNAARFPELFSGEYTWPQADPQTKTYETEIKLTKSFLKKRAQWMDKAFIKLVAEAEKNVEK